MSPEEKARHRQELVALTSAALPAVVAKWGHSGRVQGCAKDAVELAEACLAEISRKLGSQEYSGGFTK